jgi:hypothetical protein
LRCPRTSALPASDNERFIVGFALRCKSRPWPYLTVFFCVPDDKDS